jgi:membrane associated rhomboid family serine protease
MLIPIGHENMTARRWPVVTFALILINILVFIATKSALEKEWRELEKITVQALLLAATNPELEVPAEIQPLVDDFRKKHAEEWEEIRNESGSPMFDVLLGLDRKENFGGLQARMNDLAKEYARFSDSSLTYKYTYVPARPHPISYLTANFLHGGWMHLIGNMWFLWLAGFVLEDVWGRAAYLGFYLVAGVAALQLYAWTDPGSIVPTLGASGAVAALMGAFLIRFPKLKIEMLWVFLIFKTWRFRASAYWLLSIWLLTEVFYGSLFGAQTGVAHWAHVGGFMAGAAAAFVLGFTKIEKKVDAAVEEQLAGGAAPEIRQARKCIDAGQLDEAVGMLEAHVREKPASIEAWSLLRDIYSEKQDKPGCREAALKCCELHLKARNGDAAWRDYDDFVNAGGKKLPPVIQFDLCRLLENQGDFQAAANGYQRLADENPEHRYALLSQLAAGKIYLKKLDNPREAIRFFEAAEASSVPHLDMEQAIREAIQEAKAALALIGAKPPAADSIESHAG